MSDLPVVLLCHGRQERLLDLAIPKQFLEVAGEPIILRTLRILVEHRTTPALVVAPKTAPWAEFSMETEIRRLAFDGPVPSIASVAADLLRSEFPRGALFLLGDVVFSHWAVRTILENHSSIAFFGKRGPNVWTKKSHDETYAFRCDESGRIPVWNALANQKPDLPWKLRDLRLALGLEHVEISDWTDDVDDDRDLAVGLPLLSSYAKAEGVG